MRPRDFLKIGQSLLDKGRWNGKQIIAEDWVVESTAKHLQVIGADGEWGYGYQWWRENFKVEGVKNPAIFASDYGWQLMWVIPDLELVVLVLHYNPKHGNVSHSINFEEVESLILSVVTDLGQGSPG